MSSEDLTVVMVAPKCPGTEVREAWPWVTGFKDIKGGCF